MTDDAFRSAVVEKAVEYLRPKLPFAPEVGLILGSGLGGYAERLPATVVAPYADIPGFPPCAVEGHAGRLVLTDRCGPRVAILQGRAHRYEGHSLEVVTRPVRVLAALGVRTLVVTCAAGALGMAQPGELLLIEDHLNLMGDNPLIGADRGGVGRAGFVEMAGAYDPRLLTLAEDAARASAVPLRRGVLACLTGPSYETAAEAAMLARLGAQAVSMSVAPEVIVARALGLRVLGLAVLTNRAGARAEGPGGHLGVVAIAHGRAAQVGALLDEVLRRLGRSSGS